MKLVYYDRHQKPEIDAMGVAWIQDLEAMVSRCNIVTINVRRGSPPRSRALWHAPRAFRQDAVRRHAAARGSAFQKVYRTIHHR